MGGKGISVFTLSTIDNEFYDSKGDILSLDRLKKAYGNDFIIQEFLDQSDYLKQFNPTSVNTIRMNTYRDVKTGEIHILGAVLRIGQKDAVVDNATAGGVFVGIDDEGKLGDTAFDHHGKRYKELNGIKFNNASYYIPNYQACKDLAIKTSLRIPHMSLFAHDIALDRNNTPILIEVNTHCLTSYFLQTTSKPLFGEYANDIVEYCLKFKNRVGFGYYTTLK